MAGRDNRTDPRHQAAVGSLAEALAEHRAGRLDRAAALYRKILAKAPGQPDALHLLGVVTLAKGDAAQAIRLIGQCLAAMPGFASGHSNLGNALRAAGRLPEAVASYRRAVALKPDFAAAHCNLGIALGELGDREAALASLQQSVRLEPNSAAAALALANLLVELRRFADAVERYRAVLALEPQHETAQRGLAASLRATGALDPAIDAYQTLLARHPGDAGLWNDLGRCRLALGQFETATRAFRQALALDAELADAYRNLAACGQLDAADPALARLADLAARPTAPAEDRAAAGFALGKALDDVGSWDAAFAAYDGANRLYRAARQAAGDCFDGAALTDHVDRLIARFTPEFFAGMTGWGNPSELPVFILGLPRSGTSLVEQIAASHSAVFGAGEFRGIGEAAANFGPPAWTCNAIRPAADAHLARLAALGGGASRVIDKLPDNIFQLGLIATLFPNARVIFCRRDPRDIGLSCYFQKFTAGQLTFSYDLADCGRRIRETERLAEHWRRVLPLRWLELDYEALVTDLAGESRRLIDFLGLDWEPACLDFHRTDRAVQTASSWQVRQPLTDRSIGRWRHYAAHLGPLLATLGESETASAGAAAR